MDTDCRMLMHARGSASGLRKLTPPMLGTIRAAEAHTFTAEMLPGKALAAFKAAAPYLGLRPNVVHAVDWLFRFTDPVDWQPSSRPIVWPSAAMQQQDTGLGVSQVKNLNRHLVELGLVMMKDSPNGKRYGRRGPQRQIIEAYGFDLSPIASRFAEFLAIAQAGREKRAHVAALKRRATIARNGIRQILETGEEQKVRVGEWEEWQRAAGAASRGLAALKNSDEIEMAVATLERVQGEMRLCLEKALEARADSLITTANLAVDINPKGPENWPHITPTNQVLNPKDTVTAYEGGSLATSKSGRPDQRIDGVTTKTAEQSVENFRQRTNDSRTDSVSLLKITSVELMKLAPRFKPYLRHMSPSWPEVVEAADWLRSELGISKIIWGDACLAMGREQAAIAVAIVSAKPPNHFRSSLGAYFHGMVTRAKAGELHLSRTIWGMRKNGETARDAKIGHR
jgi:replication initiation protein RepC